MGGVDSTPFGHCPVKSLRADDTVPQSHVTRMVFRLGQDLLETETPRYPCVVVYRVGGGSYRRLDEGSRVLLAGETDPGQPTGVSGLNGVYEMGYRVGAGRGADKIVTLVPRSRGSTSLYVWVEEEGRGYVCWGDQRWVPAPKEPPSTANLIARVVPEGQDPGSVLSPSTVLLFGNGAPPEDKGIGVVDMVRASTPLRPPAGAVAVVQGLWGYSRSAKVTHQYRQVQLWFTPRGEGYDVGGSGLVREEGSDSPDLVAFKGSCEAIDPPGNFEDFAIALFVRHQASMVLSEAPPAGKTLSGGGEDLWGVKRAKRRKKWKPTLEGWKRASRSLLPPQLPKEARLPLSKWEATLSVLAEDGNRYQLVPSEDVEDVLFRVYNDPATGAMSGAAAMQRMVRQAYVGIRGRDVREFLERQALRQRMDRQALAVTKPPRPRYPNHWWQIDFTILSKPLVEAENSMYRYVLVVTDIFSRYAWAFPIGTRHQINIMSQPFRNLVNQTGFLPCRMGDRRGGRGRRTNCQHTVVPYLEWLFLQEGAPEVLQGDNEFRTNAMEVLCNRYGVELRFSRPMTPQSNGRVERINKTYKSIQRRFQHERRVASWIDILMRAIARYNRTPHSATGLPPLEVYKGRRVRVNPLALSLTNGQTAERQEEEALERRFSSGDFLDALPEDARQHYRHTALVQGLGGPLLRAEQLDDMRRHALRRAATNRLTRLENDWAADHSICRAMTKHPYATLRPGQLVRIRTRRKPTSRTPQRLFWTRQLYVVVSADPVKAGLNATGEATHSPVDDALQTLGLEHGADAGAIAGAYTRLSRGRGHGGGAVQAVERLPDPDGRRAAAGGLVLTPSPWSACDRSCRRRTPGCAPGRSRAGGGARWFGGGTGSRGRALRVSRAGDAVPCGGRAEPRGALPRVLPVDGEARARVVGPAQPGVGQPGGQISAVERRVEAPGRESAAPGQLGPVVLADGAGGDGEPDGSAPHAGSVGRARGRPRAAERTETGNANRDRR